MIVNRKHAEEASRTLSLDLAGLSAETLKQAWRAYAGQHHPDKGGDPARFAEGDRAKCILELWLQKAPEVAPAGLVAPPCPRCAGSGRITRQRGFRGLSVLCPSCHGTGDGAYDKDTARE